MKTYIKIKIKSLAEEAKIIKLEERKNKRWKSNPNCFTDPYTSNRNNPSKIKQKITNHAEQIHDGLYRHRIDAVRAECRSSHIAYGFLRGKSYQDIERNPRTKPNWTRIQRIVEKYGTQYFGGSLDQLQQAFQVWKYGH